MRFLKSHWRAFVAGIVGFAAVFALTTYLFINGYLMGFMIDEQWISRDEFYDRAYHPENYSNPTIHCHGHWSGLYLVNHCFSDQEDLNAFMESVNT